MVGNSSEWQRFAIALGVTVLTLTLLTVLYIATLDRGSDSTYSSTTTTSKRMSYTEGERRYITELDMEGLLDPNHTVEENLELGYRICADLKQRTSSSNNAYDLATYLFEQQSLEQMEYYDRVSFEDIYTTVGLANYHLCPSA